MPYVDVPDARLYYELHGPPAGSGEALVFAHGLGGNHLSWWQQVPHFRDRFTCLVFDHRGFARSTEATGGAGAAAFADDLRLLLDATGIHETTLVAQSMGGWTCLQFALRWPDRVRRLVLCDTHGGLASDEIEDAFSVGERGERLPPGVHPGAGPRMLAEQPGLHFLYREIDALTSMTGEQRLRTMRAAGATPLAEAATLRMPVQFIWGDEDIVIPPAVLDCVAPHIPRARIARVPESGHSVYFERAAAFNTILDAFLAET